MTNISVLQVYDITDKQTLQQVQNWVKELQAMVRPAKAPFPCNDSSALHASRCLKSPPPSMSRRMPANLLLQRQSRGFALKAAKLVSPLQVGAITLTILGNKSDMAKQQAVAEEEARGYAQSIGAEHHYVSAKTGEGISAALRQTVHRVLQRRSQHVQQHPQSYMPGQA